MSDERTKLLEAVVDAAREIYLRPMNDAKRSIFAARLDALDAHRPEPTGETVEVAGVVMKNTDEYFLANTKEAGKYHGAIVARFTVSVPVAATPTVKARVEG